MLGAMTSPDPRSADPDASDRLSEGQAEIVRRADTAFIATIAPGHGADASHRGGLPGFLECSPDGKRIRFVDYPGNGVFNTLGNLELDGRAGLTIPVFDSGDALLLTGRATVTCPTRASDSAAVVEFGVERVAHLADALPFEFGSADYSRHLPSPSHPDFATT